MNRKLFFFILCVIIYTQNLWAQDLLDDYKHIAEKIYSYNSFELVVNTNVTTINNATKNSSTKSTIYMMGDKIRMDMLHITYINDGNYELTIDKQNKTIRYTKITEKGRKYYVNGIIFKDINSYFSQLKELQYSRYIQFLGNKNELKSYTIKRSNNESVIKSMNLDIDMSLPFIKHISIHLDEELFPTDNKIDIEYSLLKINETIDAQLFSIQNIIRFSGGKAQLQPSYSKYNLYENTSD